MAELGDNEVEHVNPSQGGKPAMRWTPVMSSFVLKKFVDLVGQGVRTDKGFKEVHVNAVARALTEFIGQDVSGTQVYNHLRKWRQRWCKICRLKDLSGANWDEEQYMIVLDEEHYLGHTKDHPKDAEYLNSPLENYLPMQIIFGSGQATGRFAMGSNESLLTPNSGSYGGSYGNMFQPINLDGHEGESSKTGATSKNSDEVKMVDNNAKNEPKNLKRKRTCEDDYLVMMGLTTAVSKVADALLAPQHNEVHPDLYESVMKTPGFSEEALMFSLCYLLQNKAEGLCFVQMTEPHRVLWLRTYLTKHYYM